jgi:hypothetical protein
MATLSTITSPTVTEIPLTAASQYFQCPINGTVYQFNLIWRAPVWAPTSGIWVIDISDPTTGDPIVQGIPLVPGSNLLKPYQYLSIGGGNAELWVVSDGDASIPPTMTNLGSTSHLYLVVT